MGFELDDTESLYKIEFAEGHPYHGLTVNCSGMTIGQHSKMMRNALSRGITEEALANNEWFLDLFASKIKNWNLTSKKKAVPVSRATLDSLDSRLVSQLITRWQRELLEVPDDTAGKSGSGEISPEEALALASSSESPGS
jgi:hypothetical protein